MTTEIEPEQHLLQARIVAVFAHGRARAGGTGERVANHGIVRCSCGWSSGEQVSLIEAQRIADEQHPQGTKDHPGY